MIDYNDFEEMFQAFCERSGDLWACDCRGCKFEYDTNCKDEKNKKYMVSYLNDWEKEF